MTVNIKTGRSDLQVHTESWAVKKNRRVETPTFLVATFKSFVGVFLNPGVDLADFASRGKGETLMHSLLAVSEDIVIQLVLLAEKNMNVDDWVKLGRRSRWTCSSRPWDRDILGTERLPHDVRRGRVSQMGAILSSVPEGQ